MGNGNEGWNESISFSFVGMRIIKRGKGMFQYAAEQSLNSTPYQKTAYNNYVPGKGQRGEGGE